MIRFALAIALVILAAPQCCMTTHADEQPTHVATITIDIPTVATQAQVATPTPEAACQGPNCQSCVGCTDCRNCPQCPGCPQQTSQPAPYLQTWHPAVGITYKQRYLNKVARLVDPSLPIVCRPGYVIQ